MTIFEHIEAHVEEAKDLNDIVQVMLKSKSIDFDVRWELFKLATKANLLPEHSWQQDLPVLNELDVSWYDDFYKERYASVKWIDIVECIQDDGPIDWEDKPNKLYPHLAQIKEEIMQAGYWGFINDW